MGLIVTLIVGLVVGTCEWGRQLMVLVNEHCRVAIGIARDRERWIEKRVQAL